VCVCVYVYNATDMYIYVKESEIPEFGSLSANVREQAREGEREVCVCVCVCMYIMRQRERDIYKSELPEFGSPSAEVREHASEGRAHLVGADGVHLDGCMHCDRDIYIERASYPNLCRRAPKSETRRAKAALISWVQMVCTSMAVCIATGIYI